MRLRHLVDAYHLLPIRSTAIGYKDIACWERYKIQRLDVCHSQVVMLREFLHALRDSLFTSAR